MRFREKNSRTVIHVWHLRISDLRILPLNTMIQIHEGSYSFLLNGKFILHLYIYIKLTLYKDFIMSQGTSF